MVNVGIFAFIRFSIGSVMSSGMSLKCVLCSFSLKVEVVGPDHTYSKTDIGKGTTLYREQT